MHKALVIDDDPTIVAIYKNLLQANGFEVLGASDGAEGLLATSQFRPDVVLLDLNMPNFDGVQWLKEIRRDSRFKRLPVVVFTAGTLHWQVGAATNSDVTYVLSKDGAEPKNVIKAVEGALAISRLQLN